MGGADLASSEDEAKVADVSSEGEGTDQELDLKEDCEAQVELSESD